MTSDEILNEMWAQFDERVNELVLKLGITKKKFAERCGLPANRLSRLSKGEHHKEAYRIMLAVPRLNPRWLLFGEGEMMSKDESTIDMNDVLQAKVHYEAISDNRMLWNYIAQKDEEIAKLNVEKGRLQQSLAEAQKDLKQIQGRPSMQSQPTLPQKRL